MVSDWTHQCHGHLARNSTHIIGAMHRMKETVLEGYILELGCLIEYGCWGTNVLNFYRLKNVRESKKYTSGLQIFALIHKGFLPEADAI